MRSTNPSLAAALAAADRGWRVFPVVPRGKTPAIKAWERRATTDPAQLAAWWRGYAMNVGIATGPSRLLVVDLDHGRGQPPPERFAGARHGLDVLAAIAAEAGADVPTDTYTVSTPSGGLHLYFRAPDDVELRNTSGSLGWKIDTRAGGGYVVGAGSTRPDGAYRLVRNLPVAPLPHWLRVALTPPPPRRSTPPPTRVGRSGAYLNAILARESRDVATATTGTRHHTLLRAARTLGRLVGGGEISEPHARSVLLDAAARHVGVDGCTEQEVHRTIADGLAYGRRLPRSITDGTRTPGRPPNDLRVRSRTARQSSTGPPAAL